jgi:SGNH domain-containing protein
LRIWPAALSLVTGAIIACTGAVAPSAAAATDCFGAASLAAPAGTCPTTTSGPLTPSPATASRDLSDAYHTGQGGTGSGNCFAYAPSFAVRVCDFGDTTSSFAVALVGNSHAGQWLPALQVAAAQYHWRIITYLASRCAFAETLQTFGTSTADQNCLSWVHSVESRITHGTFRLVVMTNRISVAAFGHSFAHSYTPYLDGYTAVLKKLHTAHKRVYGIRDTPAPGFDVPGCLAAHPSNYTVCSAAPGDWLPNEPLYRAADAVNDPHIHAANMTWYICKPTRCYGAVGGVTAYRDPTHLTATYNRTIGRYLAGRLHAFLAA